MKVSNPEFLSVEKGNDRRKKVNTAGRYDGLFLSYYSYSIDPKYMERTEE
jgi:hypothetical protein